MIEGTVCYVLFSSLFGSDDSAYLNVPVGEMQELDINSGDVAPSKTTRISKRMTDVIQSES